MRFAAAVAAASLVLCLGACGGGDSPSAGSSPSPTPVPTATPTPVPTPSLPGMNSCSRLPQAPLTGHNCDRSGPFFQEEVATAVAQLRASQPDLFEDTTNGTAIKSAGKFFVGVIENLDRMGICAGFDSEELQVTTSATLNDQFHLRTSAGILRHRDSMYRATCYPAAFPTPRPPFLPANAGCPLASSLEIACNREDSSQYYQDMEAAISQVIRENPELFDTSVHPPGADWPGVRDKDRYHQLVMAALVSRGYCTHYDTEEIQMKKGTNQFSEHFDIYLGDGFVRRGTGTYRSSCYPSAF